MEDLIKLADELLKPVIHQPPTTPEECHAYYVLDWPFGRLIPYLPF
jgi:hypothetical protein